jgi:hypothetical protein
MPFEDLKSNAGAVHMSMASVYTSAFNGISLDISPWAHGAIFSFGVVSVATAGTVVTLHDSDDNTTFAAVTGETFTEPIGSPNTHRFVFVHRNKVRRYVRLNIDPGAGTLTGGDIVAFAAGRDNGVVPAVTYSIDTGS